MILFRHGGAWSRHPFFIDCIKVTTWTASRRVPVEVPCSAPAP
jgi:hypothetical protein